MAKNELLKFASGDKPNLVPFSEWEANPSVKTGFQAGIAKSAELNRVFAQGALAAHTLGEFVVEMAKENVSLETDLYKSFKKALGAYVNANLADHVVTEAKLATSIDASKFTLKIRTVSTSERKRTTFKAGELVMDNEENRLYMGDGATAGGVAVGAGGGAPTGMVAMFHASQPPEGWLLCNGASVKQKDYADLFAVIGTTYGKGSGSDTFNLPNLNHRFLEGTTSSSEVGKYVEAGLPNITGYFCDYYNVCNNCASNYGGAFNRESSHSARGGSGDLRGYSAIHLDASKDDNHYGGSSTVQPASARLLPCVKI